MSQLPSINSQLSCLKGVNQQLCRQTADEIRSIFNNYPGIYKIQSIWVVKRQIQHPTNIKDTFSQWAVKIYCPDGLLLSLDFLKYKQSVCVLFLIKKLPNI